MTPVPAPPHELRGCAVLLAWRAPTSALPADVRPGTVLGHPLLVVLACRHKRFVEEATGREYLPYNEIVYGTPAADGSLHVLRLDCNDALGVEAGRTRLGLRRTRSDVRFRKIRHEVAVESREQDGWNRYGDLLCRISLERSAAVAFTAETVDAVLRTTRVLSCPDRVRWDLSMETWWPLDLQSASFPVLGGLQGITAQPPLVAAWLEETHLRLTRA